MKIGQLPIADQVAEFLSALRRNDLLVEVMTRAAELDLPNWYLTSGCLFQTVWNVLTDRPPTEGIKDYDLFYFDNTDLSWAAEDAVIKKGAQVFADIPAVVEIRNEARVHLWYEDHFGVPCEPYDSTESAIDSFAATTCSLGIHQTPSGDWRVYAPHGFADVFNLTIRPNPAQAPKAVYETKTRRWQSQWPDLTVLPWPHP